jgi:gliding motility-associated-like protein
VKITLTTTGGDSSKYAYNWTPTSLSGKGPFTRCLTSNQRYIVKVQDGSSAPGSDTIDIVVLSPPSAQQDTEVCYYNNNFKLRATPAGGTWKGPGIVNGATGEFKPGLVYGATKVWYQIGSCTDTVIVTVWAPWNLENMFCPSKSTVPLYWYGPAGGTWSGPKTTSAGIFKPDTAGKYTLTYTWKGCTSLKTVYVQAIVVPKFDTVCESAVNAKLKFSPLGLYPQYFAGLTNYYYGTYEPSLMGGPKNYNILYISVNGCRDTTRLTVIPSDAGPNDTFCPSAGKQSLKPFRPNTNYSWKGKGINGLANIYDPSWWKSGKTNIDTLTLTSPRCQDKKFVYIINNKIIKPDTLFFCQEDTTTLIKNKGVITSIAGGIWTGPGVVNKQYFNPQITGPGLFKINYSSKGCDDTLLVVVRNKPFIQLDTSICLIDNPMILYKKDSKGLFWGNGITNSTGIFSPSKAGPGKHFINYRASTGCFNTVNIVVDTVPVIKFNSATSYCSKDSLFALQAQPLGGTFSGTGVIGSSINPKLARLGNLKVYYNLNINACATKDSMPFVVNTPLSVSVTPQNDSVCYGNIVTLNGSINGGIVANQKLNWSHGQIGLKTFYIGNKSGNLIITGSDGCSDNASDTAKIHVHPRVWSTVTLSDTVCRGLNGWAHVKLGNGNPYKTKWTHDPNYKKDTLFAPADNRYRVTITDSKTGCFGDTTIEIPGYQAIQAGFTIQKSTNTECLTPLDQTATFFNQSTGGKRGVWKWGDGKSSLFDPIVNPTHTFDGLQTSYRVMLAIENDGGCKDTAWEDICYHDTIFAFIPTAFSPNGDGINDELDCQLFGATEVTVYIINRWGEIVFESTKTSQRWNGDSAGKPCPEGVYAVLVEFKGNRQSKRVLSSSVTLLRPKS